MYLCNCCKTKFDYPAHERNPEWKPNEDCEDELFDICPICGSDCFMEMYDEEDTYGV